MNCSNTDIQRLTQKQFEILEYLITFAQKNLYQPGAREIGEQFDITPTTAYNHLVIIAGKGWIDMSQNRARSIVFSEAAKDLIAGSLVKGDWVK